MTNLADIQDEVTSDTERSIVEASTRRLYRLVDDNLNHVGGIECAAGIVGIDRGDLRRALDHKGRYLAVEHVMAIGARMRRFSPETSQRIAAAMMQPFDLVIFPRQQLTAAERARRLENLMRSMPLGDELVRKALETP